MLRDLLTLGIVTAIHVSTAFALGPEMIGKQAPAFRLKTIDERSTVSLEDCRGKVVIIDFWASWCAPCRGSLHRLAALEAAHPGVRLLAITVDDERKNAVEFLKRNNIKLTSLHDDLKRVAGQYGVPGMPSALIVDAHGVVRFVHAGYSETDIEVMRKEVEGLL
jgi:cytochrome c biogenesis protein CcmG/thiol:disulfide interchange protein DsbE